jgi:hypothetical protein
MSLASDTEWLATLGPTLEVFHLAVFDHRKTVAHKLPTVLLRDLFQNGATSPGGWILLDLSELTVRARSEHIFASQVVREVTIY